MFAHSPSDSPDSPFQLGDRTSYDVVVVGARVAGAATAMLLARQGLSVLLIDRGRVGTDTLSTHALMRAGVLQLSRWGVLDQIVDAGTPPIKRTTFDYGDEPIGITIKPSAGVDALYAPRRTILDPMLVEEAHSAGAEVHDGVTVTDLIRSGSRVHGVMVTCPDGRVCRIEARVVVGADGIRSTIAQLAGAPLIRLGAHTTAITYGYWSGLRTDGYEWIYRPDAAAGVIPTNDGKACVFASASPERIGRGGVSVIQDVVGDASPRLAERLRLAVAPLGARTWGGQIGHIRRPWGQGWALVGDAGYFKDPISAHGLTDALRDAELLARAIVAHVRDGAGEVEAFDQYAATRDRLSLPLFDVVDRIASHQWDMAEIANLLLQLNSAMADEVETLSNLDPLPVP
jgi:2-polyprenyl-6-methoxyphenol hydroxylase-like FAD-dependent oxidoreductase